MPTNSALLTNDRWMPVWLKFSFFAAFIVFACWGVAIAYWRTPGHNPAAGDLALYLLGLPSGLLLLFFIGYKTIGQRQAAQSPATSSTPAKVKPAPPQARSLAILAASLRLPHGASPEELAEAIVEDKARADLDKELVDDDGFPILSVRSSEALDEALQEEIAQWLAVKGMAEVSFSDEQWRALTLATAVTGEIAGQAASLLLPQAQQPPPTLTLVPILPADWQDAQRQAAAGWLSHLVAQCGWPADHIAVPERGTNTDQPSKLLSSLSDKMAAATLPSIAVLVACCSAIGDETVSRWASDGILFTSSQPRGRVPGEGAVALLIAGMQHAKSIDGAVYALLEAVEEASRDTSIDESRRTDSALLGTLVERSLERGGIGLEDVGMVIADTGQRANRVFELMERLSAAMPQLDDKEDVLRVGAACGSCGAVPFITALALARHFAIERGANVVCVSNEDPFQRVVGLVRVGT